MRKSFFGTKKKGGSLDPDEILVDSVSVLRGGMGEENKLERPLEQMYAILFLSLVGGGMVYLLFSAFTFQISRGDEFFSQAQENRFLVRSVLPPRGIIYDHTGQLLVENVPSFGLMFEKSAFREKSGNLDDLLSALSVLLKKDKDFFFELGFPENNVLDRLPSRILITQDLKSEDVFSLAPRLDSLPGLTLVESYRRRYPAPYALSHLLGFVGKVSAEELRIDPALYREDFIGKSGIEGFYDALLRGRGGRKIVEVDAGGHEGRVRFVEEPQEGTQLTLTIDRALQEKIYDVVMHYTGGTKGASVVAVDPQSGAVRALLSFPGFDSNQFSATLSKKEFEEITKNPLRPMFNRAIGGEFPSGSTIKPLIAAAALEERLVDPQKKIYDEGFIEIPNPYHPGERAVFRDWRVHGWINFYDAIAWSANVYFYMIGGGYKDQQGLGIERIKKYASAFGLGAKLGIDLPGEKSGLIPDPSIKAALEPQDSTWRIGDTYNVSIGQGGVKVTPLQMAMMTAVVANGGTLYQPYLLARTRNLNNGEEHEIAPHVTREHVVSEESLLQVRKGMRQTVTAGTAGLLANVPAAVAAKTGTAQAGSGLPHAWVSIFAPFDNPKIAMVVMVEHAGEGSTVAVPITREILEWYFSKPRL